MAIQNPVLRHAPQHRSALPEGASVSGSHSDCQSSSERPSGEPVGSQAHNKISGTISDFYNSESDESGQCRRLRDHLRIGEQDLMSEKDPASRLDPSSKPVSPRAAASSPRTSLQPNARTGVGDPSADRESPENSRVPRTNGDLTQPYPHRAIGVHTILNPTESQGAFTNNYPGAQRPAGETSNSHTTAGQYGSSPTTQRPYSYPGHGTLRGQQASPTPPVGSPVSGLSSDRASPNVLHPHPGIGTTRRYLTPRSPRSSGTNQGPIRRPGSSQQASFLPGAPSGMGRMFPIDNAAPGPPLSPRSGHPLPLAPYYGGMGTPRGTPTSSAPPPRPLSHPASTPFAIPGQISPTTQGPSGHIRPQGFPSPYSAGAASSNLSYPPSLPPTHSRRSGSFSSISHQGFTLSDGQPMLAINPEGGERMLIPVNTDHASKAADEKRQRNAGASARFRQRKKDKDEAKDVTLRRIEGQYRELERRNRDLEAELDRVRVDRNRLRDIVAQTSGISDLAYQSPPSPAPRRSSGPYPERSPLAPVIPPAPVAGFTHPNDDPHAGERAARRRRTDPQLAYSMSNYVSNPGVLQQAPSPTYNTSLSQPGTPSAAAPPPSTLPPLRLEPSSGPPSTPGLGSASSQPNYSYRREPYESGWATRSSDTSRDPNMR